MTELIDRRLHALDTASSGRAPVWAVHDLFVGSLPGIIADVCSTATGAWMLFQHLRNGQASN
jgi:hypothetical protein